MIGSIRRDVAQLRSAPDSDVDTSTVDVNVLAETEKVLSAASNVMHEASLIAGTASALSGTETDPAVQTPPASPIKYQSQTPPIDDTLALDQLCPSGTRMSYIGRSDLSIRSEGVSASASSSSIAGRAPSQSSDRTIGMTGNNAPASSGSPVQTSQDQVLDADDLQRKATRLKELTKLGAWSQATPLLIELEDSIDRYLKSCTKHDGGLQDLGHSAEAYLNVSDAVMSIDPFSKAVLRYLDKYMKFRSLQPAPENPTDCVALRLRAVQSFFRSNDSWALARKYCINAVEASNRVMGSSSPDTQYLLRLLVSIPHTGDSQRLIWADMITGPRLYIDSLYFEVLHQHALFLRPSSKPEIGRAHV